MRIIIKATNLELGKGLKDEIEKKINSLERFLKKAIGKQSKNKKLEEKKPKIEAFVEVAKTTQHHKKGKVFYAECQIKFPGGSLRAEAEKESLDLALQEIKEKLEREIKSFKEKKIAKQKRRARKAKKELLLSNLAKEKEKKREWQEGI